MVGPTSSLASELLYAADALRALDLRFAVVGGLAVSVRTEPRFTRDVDLAVAVSDDEESERVVHQLLVRGYKVLGQVEQEAAGRLASVRLRRAGGEAPVLDVLFASSGIESEVVESAEAVEVFPGVAVPVAATAHLIALKLLAQDDQSRPQDRSDLAALLSVCRESDRSLARRLIHLISERGYARGRDLDQMLDAAIEQHRP